jgi:hypothetical protein
MRWLYWEVAVYRASVANALVLYAKVAAGAQDTFRYKPFRRTLKSPHKAGFINRVGGRCWSPAYKVYQASHRTVLCCPASHGIRAGSQRGDLSNRVPFGARPTFPRHPLAHQSASSPTTSRLVQTPKRKAGFLERFCTAASAAGWKNTNARTPSRVRTGRMACAREVSRPGASSFTGR